MAIVLEANYAKKLGLPGYSSHQYSVSIRTELTDLSRVEEESSRLYRLLQDAVDDSIRHPGFLPDAETAPPRNPAVNGSANSNGNGASAGADAGAWRCSDKQRELIEKIVAERHLDKNEVEQLARDRFGAGVRQLDRLQASGLIDELLEGRGAGVKPAARRANGRTSNGRVRA